MTRKTTLSLKKLMLFIAPFAFFGCHPTYARSYTTMSQNEKIRGEVVKTFQKLMHGEVDTLFLLQQSREQVGDSSLSHHLLVFQKEAEATIKDISHLLTRYGSEVPKISKDIKGHFMNGYIAVRGAFSDQGVMKGLYVDLNFILKSSSPSINASFTTIEKKTIQKFYRNKIKILNYLKNQIHKPYETERIG